MSGGCIFSCWNRGLTRAGMDTIKIVLLLIVSGLWIFTACTLLIAVTRRVYLVCNARWAPDYQDLRMYANDQVVIESLRLTKHTILCALIAMTPGDPPQVVEIRNIGIAAVGILIGVTSALALYRRRRRYRHFTKRNP